MASLESESNRLIWVVIGIGIAGLIGGVAYAYFNTNLNTWLSEIGSAMTGVRTP